jgi:spore coat polysaccharide biosynthesis protein SpsF
MKIGFLITARLKSSRLPLKVIMPLNGKTVIERIIDRIKEIHEISEIVLCTSHHPQDRPLVEIAKNNDIYYFCGDEVDVLKRLYDAGRFFGLDYFIGITADNPLLSIYYSNRIVDEIKKTQYDFIEVKGLPFGSATYGMNMKALKTVCAIKEVIDTEIWGSLIRRPEVFSIKTIEVKGVLNRPDLRFTLDYTEDYELLQHIYSSVPFTNVLNLLDIIQHLNKNPHIAEINKNCVQLDIDDEIKMKIDRYYSDNLDKILKIKQSIYESWKL